ncbi:hypothetical protein [Suttonella ornithocola]|uniref:Endodeoxyribonuclease RUS n=1 Tax=Suttonella ornithocola TaxID=279832 RepID=A0A380MRG2_9GAMM|nr:hypothetical protein [Suttonella ornithocola]SUO95229.1 endodeoxyribonuclease RUS [Suttonella ornithocola]
MNYRVTLPFPPSELMPNNKNGRHWAVTHKAKLKAREDAYFLTLQAGWRGADVSNGIKVTFYLPDKRRRDNDNLLAASKPALDGFAKAIGVDDSNFNPLLIVRVDKVDKKNEKNNGDEEPARMEIERL